MISEGVGATFSQEMASSKEDVLLKKASDIISKKADGIIMQHLGFTILGALVPIPFVDLGCVIAVQVDMLKNLASLYEISFDKEKGKSIATALVGTTMARFFVSSIKFIPGIGTVVGSTAQVGVSGAATYALGKVFKNHFESGGNLFSFDIESKKEEYKRHLKEGKKLTKEKKNEMEKDKEDHFQILNQLKEMKDNEIISEDDFNKTKAAILEKITN